MKVDLLAALKPALWRLLRPDHLLRAVRLAWRHRRRSRRNADGRLQFFADLLPGGYLNYGYHEDSGVRPDELSLNDLARAQARYAELIFEQVADIRGPILDVGCGVGGLLDLMHSRGLDATGLTPDRLQFEYLRTQRPDLKVIHSALESLDTSSHHRQFEALITAESLQYLRLEQALRSIDELLAPTGRWIICDCFRTDGNSKGGGQNWSQFLELLKGRRWRIVFEKDISLNVLPTFAHVHMLYGRVGLPLLNFGASEFERKRPGLHYLFQESLERLRVSCDQAVKQVDPDFFLSNRKYTLLIIERIAVATTRT